MVTVQSLLEPVIGHYRRLSNSYHSCIIIWVHLISSVWIKLHIHQLRPIQQSRQKVLWSCCPKIILCLELLVSLCCNKGIFPLKGSTLEYQINEHVRLFFFRKKPGLCILISYCAVINLKIQILFSIFLEKNPKL